MTVTWLFCGLYLWDALFFSSRLTFFQSKKEDDADENVERAYTMYTRLPDFMKAWNPASRTFCNFRLKKTRSRIMAVPQGADHARQFTCSGYFSDEVVYQEEVDKVLAAIAPTLGEKGRFTGVSSAGPSYFQMLCFDKT
jgi:hypothetical protein